MCNEAGDVSRLSFNQMSLFDLSKELAETEEMMRNLESRKHEMQSKKEPERLAAIQERLQLLGEKAGRLRSEIAAAESQMKPNRSDG